MHAARVADEEFSAPGLVGAVHQSYASAITRDGTAVVASRTDPAGNVSAVKVHEQSSGNAPWTRTRVSAVPASPPALAAQADGTVVMLWADRQAGAQQAGAVIAAASRGPQGGWSAATTLRAPGATADIAPQLIATSTGLLAAWAFSEQGFIDPEGRTVIAEIDAPRVTASRVLPGGDAGIEHPEQMVTGRLAGGDRDGAWMIWSGRGILASYCDGSACSAQARVARGGSRDRLTTVAQFGHGDHPAVLWVDGDGALLEGRLTR